MIFKGKPLKNIPDRIWADAEDVYVCNYVIYPNGSGVACFDSSGLIPVGAEILENLYKKGVLISVNGVYYTPLAMSITESVVTISYFVAALATVVSYDEPEPEPEPVVPKLTALSLGALVLTPPFSTGTLIYTTSTVEVSDLLSFTVSPEGAEAVVKLGENIVVAPEEAIVWSEGENILTITLGDDEAVVYTIAVSATVTPDPVAPKLTALSLGAGVFTPTFDSATLAYAVATVETSDLLAFVVDPAATSVVVKLDGAVMTDTVTIPLVWGEDAKVVTIELGEDTDKVTYTLTVTQTAT